MKIGIYLAYPPYLKPVSLKKEGLGRYLSALVGGFVRTGNELTIACPRWVLPMIEELLEDQNIPTDNIELLTPAAEPILLKAYIKWVNRTRKKKVRKYRLQKAVLRNVDGLLDLFLRVKNVIVFGLLLIACAVLGLALLPFVLVAWILMKICKLVKWLGIKLFKVNLFKRVPVEKLKEVYYGLELRGKYSERAIQEKIRQDGAREILRKARNLNNPPDVWYCPMAFWSEFHKLPGTKVVCAPDVVTTEYPSKFSQGNVYEATKPVVETLEQGEFFITYCEYVKESLLINKFFKREEDVIAIPHANNEMLNFLDIRKYYEEIPFKEDPTFYFARKVVLPGIMDRSVNMGSFLMSQDRLNHFSLQDVDYIFYPSQVRGNKNILNLVKAYEYLLREKNVPLKLILTCNINHDPQLKEYIEAKRLQYDVLSFYDLTAQQLAALYMCAKLVVNPTLYEGGFPFTFGEGMSVETPSVMSRIPQVEEELAGCGLDDYLFDPYDYVDMAHKIQKCLENLPELLEKEKEIYLRLKERNWDVVCGEYIQAFRYFMDRKAAEAKKTGKK